MRLFAVVLVVVVLVGCGARETPVEEAEQKAGVEEVVEEPTQAPPRDAKEAAADEAKRKAAEQGKGAFGQQTPREKATNVVAAHEAGGSVDDVQCQIAKVQLDLGEEEAARLLSGWDPQWIGTPGTPDAYISPTLPEFLAERGYDC